MIDPETLKPYSELRALVEGKWGQAYGPRLHRRRDGPGQLRISLEVAWKHTSAPSTCHCVDDLRPA